MIEIKYVLNVIYFVVIQYSDHTIYVVVDSQSETQIRNKRVYIYIYIHLLEMKNYEEI